jgi:hypothetical protein
MRFHALLQYLPHLPRQLFALIGLCALGVLPVSAQALRPVDCRLLWFDPETQPPVMVNLGPDGSAITCDFSPNTLSPSVRLHAGNGVIRFLDDATRKPAAAATIPDKVNKAILVFIPAAKAAAGNEAAATPRVFVIDDSPQSFPNGGAFVANLFSGDIRFVIGEHRNQLRTGNTLGLKQPVERDEFNMAPVIIQFQQGDSWRTASESVVRFIPETRYLILAYVDPASGRPRISTITDVVPAVTPEP